MHESPGGHSECCCALHLPPEILMTHSSDAVCAAPVEAALADVVGDALALTVGAPVSVGMGGLCDIVALSS